MNSPVFLKFLCLLIFESYAAASLRVLGPGPVQSKPLANNGPLHQIRIEDYADNMYLLKVSLGTPPQNFSVQMDSSSADFWLVDSTCTSRQCKGKVKPKNRYNAAQSRTYREDETEFLVEYNHRGVSGRMGQDAMSIGDILIESQSFGRGILLDQSFGTQPMDGILGLGRPELSQTGAKSPLQNTLEQMQEHTTFSIYLNSRGSPGGMLTFGGLDAENCDSDWAFVNLTHSFYWGFSVQKARFGDQDVGAEGFEAIASTKEPFIDAPTWVFQQIISSLNAKQVEPYDFYEIPCDKIIEVPELTFEIQGRSFTLRGSDYVRDVKVGAGHCVVCVGDSSKKGYNANQWLFGIPFLQKFCTAYMWKNKQMGFSMARNG